MAEHANRPLRILLMGLGGTGKSSLALRFTEDRWLGESVYNATIEERRTLTLELASHSVSVELVDSSGQEEFLALSHSWLAQADAIMLCYAYNSEPSRGHAERLLKPGGSIYQERKVLRPERRAVLGGKKSKAKRISDGPHSSTNDRLASLPVLLVATKADLFLEPGVEAGTHEALRKLGENTALSYNMHFVETSAKTNFGVRDAFQMAIQLAQGACAHFDSAMASSSKSVVAAALAEDGNESDRLSDPLDHRVRAASHSSKQQRRRGGSGRDCAVM